MIFDPNILKIAGAFVAGLAGIIGILGQTRTHDNKLTRSGKWLFGMAIVGVVLALGTQIWEWRKSIEEDRAARQRSQALLEKLDREAHDIRRAVTRFQVPSISFDFGCSFDSTNKLFGPYILDITKLAEAVISKPHLDFEKSDDGLRLYGVNRRLGTWSFRIDADSSAMPDETRYAALRHYIFDAVPQVYIFKTQIPLANFVAMPPAIVHGMSSQVPVPDLILKLSPGDVSVTFAVQKREPQVSSVKVVHSGMNASVLFSSGVIVSLEDLGGCQAVICRTRQEFEEPWNLASNPSLACRVNDQTVAVCSKLALRSPWFCPLASTKTEGPVKQLIHSFVFPSAAAAKAN